MSNLVILLGYHSVSQIPGEYNPWPYFQFTGPLRPFPRSSPRTVPAHIARPDYAETGESSEERRAKVKCMAEKRTVLIPWNESQWCFYTASFVWCEYRALLESGVNVGLGLRNQHSTSSYF